MEKVEKSMNIYGLPYREEDLEIAVSFPNVHFPPWDSAVDFILPEGVEILAALDGEVVQVMDDSSEGGLDDKYRDVKYMNLITIKHENNELTQYIHLQHKSAKIKIGDRVKKGQVIGLVGNTGLSGRPHLHFHVLKLDKSKIGFHVLAIKFEKKIKVDKSTPKLPKGFDKVIDEAKREWEETKEKGYVKK
ncbi:M23 family metallopeptidase [Nanoarchaeota archaeon]